jgi:hypothetical protein
METVTGHFAWVKEYWPLAMFSVGALGGWVIWAMRRMFATHSVMNDCKLDLIRSLEAHEREETIRALEFKRENALQHQDIRADMRQIIDHLIGTTKP